MGCVGWWKSVWRWSRNRERVLLRGRQGARDGHERKKARSNVGEGLGRRHESERDVKVRTHRCGELTKAHVGQSVVLQGWVQRRRDHGVVMFIDLRDRTGITQGVFNAELNRDVHTAAHKLRSECVVCINGQVMARPEDSKNPNLSTGE